MRCKCGKEISERAKSCKSCSNRNRKYTWQEAVSISKRGNKNPKWKGDEVKYDGLHAWIKRHKPKVEFCENCHKEKSFDLANISGEYKRNIKDFKWLCRSCHMKEDGRMLNLKQYKNE